MNTNALEEIKKIKDNKTKLQKLVEKFPSAYKMYLENEKYGFSTLLKWICDKTPSLSDSIYELKTKIYWILNDIKSFPLCEVDSKPLIGINVYSVQQGYRELVCCKKCRNMSA